MIRTDRFLLLPFAALLFLAGCSGPSRAVVTEQAPPAVRERPAPNPVELPPAFAHAIDRGTRTETGQPGPRYWQQQTAYTMTARLFPDDKRFEGQARIRYQNASPDSLRRLHFELAQNLHAAGSARNEAVEVTSGVRLGRVAVGGTALAEASQGVGYRVQGTQLVVTLPTTLAPGGHAEVEIDWSYQIPKAGAGGRMGHSRDSLFFMAYWYPIASVYDDVEGWNTDPFLGQAEFYADFGDYDVTVEAPPGWIVAATGTLQNPDDVLAPAVVARMRRAHASDTPMRVVGPEDFGRATAQASPDGRLRWRFTADHVRDFAFSATRASIWDAARTPVGDRDGDGTTDYAAINTFYRAAAPLWAEVTRYQQHAISFLSDHTAVPYPWPHMTAVEGAGIITGGMEYPMMTLMGDYNTRGDSALYHVTAHELAHMWVPLIVGTNERRYSWMDEGTTTFNENQARKDFFPGPDHDLGDQDLYLAVARAGQEGEMMRWSNYHYPGPAFTVASYMKPATVLAALRALLGDETFFRAFHTFLDEWAFKHPYPYDLFNTFERVSGRDLGWFWRSWYFETWTLDHAVASVDRTGEATQITIEDRGRTPMPARLVITLANGETLHREVPVETWLGGRRRAAVTVNTASPVVRVEIDPARDFPDVDRSNNIWKR